MRDRICAGTDLETAEARILRRIRERGYRSFDSYLGDHTVRRDGTAWTLSQMAADLDVSPAQFIRYHSRWVEANSQEASR